MIKSDYDSFKITPEKKLLEILQRWPNGCSMRVVLLFFFADNALYRVDGILRPLNYPGNVRCQRSGSNQQDILHEHTFPQNEIIGPPPKKDRQTNYQIANPENPRGYYHGRHRIIDYT